MNIILIGYRGTGKTTIGQLLAQKLNRSFVDIDAMIVERAGKTIRDIFEACGESGFRDLETEALAQAMQHADRIVAAGGGIVLRPKNVALMKAHGKIAWLQASAETLHARILADSATLANRPNLTAGGGIEEIRELLTLRTPMYQSAADLALDVTDLSPAQAAEALAAELRN